MFPLFPKPETEGADGNGDIATKTLITNTKCPQATCSTLLSGHTLTPPLMLCGLSSLLTSDTTVARRIRRSSLAYLSPVLTDLDSGILTSVLTSPPAPAIHCSSTGVHNTQLQIPGCVSLVSLRAFSSNRVMCRGSNLIPPSGVYPTALMVTSDFFD